MDDLLATLNNNAGALSVVFSALVTLATVVYAGLTWKLVTETRLMRQVQTEPKVEVVLKSLDFALHIVRLHIQNVGLGPAQEVRFKFQPIAGGDAATSLIQDFSETNFFKVGLAYFGAGQERYSHYTQMTKDHDGKIASVISIEVTYRSALGKSYRDVYVIDMSEYKGSYQLGRPHMYSVAQSLDKLQKSVNDIATGFRRPKVDVFTAADRDAEHQAMEEYRQEFAAKKAGRTKASEDET